MGITRKLTAAILTVTFVTAMSSAADQLETIAQWPLLDFALPYDPAYLQQFQPENVVPTGIEVGWHRVFISTPRLRTGVPATLGYIPRHIPPGSSPQLQAYPSWDWHTAGKGELNCSGLISVYRIRADRCNRLWVLDSGVMTSLDEFQTPCPPKILVFDLQTDQLVRQISFPRNVVRLNSLFTNLVVDDTAASTCDDVFVYITDTASPGIVVYDGATDKSWRFIHASMLPHPDYSTYLIAGETFELFDAVVGLGFSPSQGILYYQPLATDRLFSVPTSALQAGPLPMGEQLPVTLVGRKSSQGIGLSVDPRDDTILFAPLTETAIAAWTPRTNDQRIIAYSPEELQFTAEVRWIERDDGNVWALSSRFQKFFKKTVDPREINLRILRVRPSAADPTPISRIASYNRIGQNFIRHFYNNTLAI